MNDERTTIYVPSRHLGLIIGKGGSRIKELSEECGCRINIKKDQAVNDEVPVYLEGSSRNIEKAKSKIDEITRRQHKRHMNDNDSHYNESDNDKSFSNSNYSNKRSSKYNDDDDYDNSSSWKRKSPNDDRNERSYDKDKYNSSRTDDSSWRNGNSRNNNSYNDNNNDYNSNSRSSYRDHDNDYSHGSSKQRANNVSRNNVANGDDWGGWGKKNDDNADMDALIFSGEELMKSNLKSNFVPSESYVQDDDWGIPTYLEEEKPIRKRPDNANIKMKCTKDSNFYPVHRNFYREHPSVSKMTIDEKEKFLLDKNNIIIKEIESETGESFCNFGSTTFDKDPEELIDEIPIPKVIPNPVRNFEESFFDHPDILTEIRKQKFQEPSPIQCIAWPILMTGRDLIGIAQTGTGKTLAFLLPAFIHIEGQPKPREKRQGPTVLILSPTRELAIQIQNEVQKYTYHDIDSVVCYGGADKRDQIYQLKENPEIVVGTPGRIQDLKDSGVLNLKDVSYLVLDEADRMLDMGFEIQVVNLIYAVRRQRQTVMTSATWPFGVQRIALTHMKNPVQVNVGTLDLNACHTVKQHVEYVDYHDKTQRLVEILAHIKPEDKIIIFVARKAQCSDLAFELFLKRSKGLLGPKGAVKACEIHGDLDQQEREMALKMMRSGARNIMIATDVASRGLDIPDLTKVINYDFPKNIEEYVHRVGRTGRAGRTGEAFTFMNKNDMSNAAELIRILQDADQEVPDFLPQLMKDHQDYRINGGGRGGRFGGRGGGRGRGGGGGGFGGDRDRGGQRNGSNFNRRNKFDDTDDVQTDSSWPDFTNRSLSINSKLSKCYIQDEASDNEYWGNWNQEVITEKEAQPDIVMLSPNKVEQQQQPKIKISTQHCIKPFILANKDRSIYPIHRNFYEEHPDIRNLSLEEVESFLLRKNNIMIKELKTFPTQLDEDCDQHNDDFDEDQVEVLPGTPGIAKPIRSFEEMFWKHPEILDIIKALNFETPTPIQCIGWPVILGGRDFIGIAQTGTGKTLTFVLPALIHIEGQMKPRQYRYGPTVLILSPTRELAMQIESEILKIKYHNIKSVCCYGGAEKMYQINSLRDNPEIVVGTPGRINDLVLMGCLNLKDVSYLVLDEADRMLDMGFEPQVVSIINDTRKQRQSIMTSATWPECVRQIALLYMDNPVQVNVGSLDLIACNDVVQEIKFVTNFDKTNELINIICDMNETDKVIVFVTRKVQCRSLTKYLDKLIRSNQLSPFASICEIHGDLSQEDREQSLSWFRDGHCSILIATNVASRGLDIADITCVVNYDFPKDIEEYVHRVGRTGRAGKAGKSITFMNEADWKHSFELRNILIQSNQNAPSWLLNLKLKKLENDMEKKPLPRSPVNTTVNSFARENRKYIYSFDNDYDSYDDYEDGDFFEEYQRQCDPKIDLEVASEQSIEKENQKSINEKVVIEQVIEYHSDCLNELYDQEDDSYFDQYQKEIDPQCNQDSDKIPDVEITNVTYDYEYESDDNNYESWW